MCLVVLLPARYFSNAKRNENERKNQNQNSTSVLLFCFHTFTTKRVPRPGPTGPGQMRNDILDIFQIHKEMEISLFSKGKPKKPRFYLCSTSTFHFLVKKSR